MERVHGSSSLAAVLASLTFRDAPVRPSFALLGAVALGIQGVARSGIARCARLPVRAAWAASDARLACDAPGAQALQGIAGGAEHNGGENPSEQEAGWAACMRESPVCEQAADGHGGAPRARGMAGGGPQDASSAAARSDLHCRKAHCSDSSEAPAAAEGSSTPLPHAPRQPPPCRRGRQAVTLRQLPSCCRAQPGSHSVHSWLFRQRGVPAMQRWHAEHPGLSHCSRRVRRDPIRARSQTGLWMGACSGCTGAPAVPQGEAAFAAAGQGAHVLAGAANIAIDVPVLSRVPGQRAEARCWVACSCSCIQLCSLACAPTKCGAVRRVGWPPPRTTGAAPTFLQPVHHWLPWQSGPSICRIQGRQVAQPGREHCTQAAWQAPVRE